MTVPKGFKQTEVGVIPEDWETVQLGNLSEKVGSGITPFGGRKAYKASGRPFVRSQNVGWGTLLLDDVAFIDDATHATFSKTEIHVDDVLLNITGASIGRSAVADHRIAFGNVSQHVCVIRSNKTMIVPQFLNYFLLSDKGQAQIGSFQTGGNRQGLNFSQVRSICIAKPKDVAEQSFIAKILSDMDSLIEGTEKLLKKKRLVKIGAMQELLTGRRRTRGFESNKRFQQTEIGMIPEDWKIVQLFSVGAFFKGRNIPKSETGREGIPCVLYGEIYTKYNCIEQVIQSKVSEITAKNSFEIKKGDILFACSGETAKDIGKCFSYLGESKAVVGGDIAVLRPEYEFDSAYLGYALNSMIAIRQKHAMGQGSSIFHIYINGIRKVKIPVPPTRSEQTAIAAILSDMDSEIRLLESQLAKSRQLKTGMMQELLSGRKRLA